MMGDAPTPASTSESVRSEAAKPGATLETLGMLGLLVAIGAFALLAVFGALRVIEALSTLRERL